MKNNITKVITIGSARLRRTHGKKNVNPVTDRQTDLVRAKPAHKRRLLRRCMVARNRILKDAITRLKFKKINLKRERCPRTLRRSTSR